MSKENFYKKWKEEKTRADLYFSLYQRELDKSALSYTALIIIAALGWVMVWRLW